MSRWVLIVVILLGLGFAGLGGYAWWQHGQIGQLQDTLASSGGGSSSAALNTSSTGSGSADVKVSAVAYPAALTKQARHVVMSLHLPTGFNALDVSPVFGSSQDQDAFYVTGAGDIMARWLFSAEGGGTNPAKVADGNDELDVTALDGWMKAADPAGVNYADGTSSMNPAQKSDYVAKLKSDSAACAADASKGFATNDKTFNICVSLVKPPNTTTDWGLSVKGYGEPGEVATLIRGLIDLPGSNASNNQSEAAIFVGELKQLSATVVAGSK